MKKFVIHVMCTKMPGNPSNKKESNENNKTRTCSTVCYDVTMTENRLDVCCMSTLCFGSLARAPITHISIAQIFK